MRRFHLFRGHKLVVALLFLTLAMGSIPAPTSAQDDGEDPCPEGQVYDADQDLCVDPDEVPAEDDSGLEDVSSDDSTSEDETADDSVDDSSDPSDDSTDGEESAGDDVPPTVTNVVLHAYSCPDGWDVDTEGLDASYDPCSTQPASEGTLQASGPEGVSFDLVPVGDLDAASTGTALPAGTWTVTQTSGGPAWANCLVFDIEGTMIDQVTGPVEGTSLSFDLASGDWLECEWFINGATGSSVTNPTGEPIGSLVATSHVCPYGITPENLKETFEEACIDKSRAVEPEIVASIDGTEIARGMSRSSDTTDVIFTPASGDTYPSGLWTITQELTADYSTGRIWCSTTLTDGTVVSTSESDETGAVTIEVASGDTLACAVYAVEIAPRTGTFPSLTVIPHTCPAGTAVSAATLETCTLAIPVAIPISFEALTAGDNEGGSGGSTQLSEDLPQAGIEGQLVTGDWRITLDVPEGWQTPVLTCSATFFQPTGETTPRTLRVTAPMDNTAGTIVAIGPGHIVTCDAFIFTEIPADGTAGDAAIAGEPAGDSDDQAPVDTSDRQGVFADPPTATGVRVNFTVRNCEAGTVATDDLSGKCLTPAAGVTFTVANETSTLTTGTTSADGNVEFANMPDDVWAFTETLPAGYGEPVVVCMGTNQPEGYMEVLFGNQVRVPINMFSGDVDPYLDCTWFNLPATGPDTGPNIFIQARRCTFVNMPANFSLTQAEGLCPDVFADKTFTVDVNGGEIESDASRTNGQVFFTKLAAPNGGGIYGVSVALGHREEVAAVFCDNDFGGDAFHTVTAKISNGNRIDQELYEGHTLRCSWFIEANPPVNPNITPVPGASANYPVIQIYNRECPATVDLSQSNTDVCPQDVTGVAFDIYWNGELRETQSNSAQNGMLLYQPGGQTGPYMFAPRPIEGYGDLRFTCDFASPNGAGSSTGTLTTDSPGITIEFDGTGGVMCVIYYQLVGADEFVQDVVPGVSLVARLCNPGADLTQTDIDAACPNAGAGIAFNVDSSGEPYLNSTTDAEGVIDVPLPVGDASFTITPQAPAGYGLPGYLCVSIQEGGGGGGKVVRLTADTPSHDLAWTSDSETTCTYYFPVVAGSAGQGLAAGDDAAGQEEDAASGPNTLTIQIWTCPTGFDPAADQTQLLIECAVDVESRDMSVTTDGQTTSLAIVGNGQWEFQEDTVVVGIGGDLTSTVWCSSTWIENGEDGGDFPAVAPVEGGALTLTVSHTATTIYCDWFVFAA